MRSVRRLGARSIPYAFQSKVESLSSMAASIYMLSIYWHGIRQPFQMVNPDAIELVFCIRINLYLLFIQYTEERAHRTSVSWPEDGID